MDEIDPNDLQKTSEGGDVSKTVAEKVIEQKEKYTRYEKHQPDCVVMDKYSARRIDPTICLTARFVAGECSDQGIQSRRSRAGLSIGRRISHRSCC